MKLFCLPYAGGSASLYASWKRRFHDGTEVVPIELAGRGVRRQAAYYRGMADAAEDVLAQLLTRVDESPYAVFGHSMGGMIAYETAHLIRERRLRPPALLIVSGRPAPHVPRTEDDIHGLPDDAFIARILAMGGTAPELFADESLRGIFLPILRADFRLVETYGYEERPPLPYPVAVLAGQSERWTDEELEGWRRHTASSCRIHRVEGGHFYWNGQPDRLTSLLAAEFSRLRSAT